MPSSALGRAGYVGLVIITIQAGIMIFKWLRDPPPPPTPPRRQTTVTNAQRPGPSAPSLRRRRAPNTQQPHSRSSHEMQHAQKRPEQRNSQVAVNEPPGGQPSDYTPGHVERRSATPSPAITTPPADQNSEAWRIAHLEEPPLSRPPAQESDVQQEESEAPSAMQESAAPSCAEEGSAPSGAESPSATSNYLPTPRSDSGRLPRLSLVLSEPAARAERTSSPTPEAHSSPSGSSSLLRFPSDPSIASDIVISTGGSNSGSDGSPSVISSPSEILSPGSVFSDFTVVAEDDDESDIFFSPRSEMFSPVGSVMGRTF